MKIAFIHYHLKTGGVTTVLKQQVEALKEKCEVLVLSGELPDESFPADSVHIPGLGYDSQSQKKYDPEKVADDIIKAVFSRWNNGCDVLHVHNPMLAKNIIFLKILKALQKRGIKLFLQIHDLAEDGRPLSYFSEEYVSDCHYGVINSRDYNILLKAGLKKQGLHKIFNTIKPLDFSKEESDTENYVLYPIRAIRRKNIGEAILLSLFFQNNETLVTTLPPNSISDIISYVGWKNFVKKNNLNVEFEAGLKKDFSQLVLSAKFIITTSITEGFGFSFLEPWTAKKILWGRKLPDICHDFEKNGIKLDHLYDRLIVPIEWIGKDNFYEVWKTCVLRNCSLFNFKINAEKIQKSFSKITLNEHIDFGLLYEPFQKQIISHVLSSKNNANKLIKLNPKLALPLNNLLNNKELIQNNMNAVLNNYNQITYRTNLIEIYSKIINNPVQQRIDKNILLSEFINLEQFSLLKWNDYVE
jgi:glycosyltransferase involved in cell wall biosynthesis